MAKLRTVSLVDDLDGSAADETVTFGLDGRGFEVDLSSSNAAQLRAAFGPYLAAGRRVTRRGVRAAAGPSRSGGDNASIRA